MEEVVLLFMNIQGIYTITMNPIKGNQSKQIEENILQSLLLFCNILQSLCDLLPYSVTKGYFGYL